MPRSLPLRSVSGWSRSSGRSSTSYCRPLPTSTRRLWGLSRGNFLRPRCDVWCDVWGDKGSITRQDTDVEKSSGLISTLLEHTPRRFSSRSRLVIIRLHLVITHQVYTNPFQWSFPLNLPSQFYGIFSSGDLVNDDKTTPWADEIEQKLLLPPSIGAGY